MSEMETPLYYKIYIDLKEQIESGKFKYTLNNNLKKLPIKLLKVINPAIYAGLFLAGLLGLDNSVNITINGGAKKYI